MQKQVFNYFAKTHVGKSLFDKFLVFLMINSNTINTIDDKLIIRMNQTTEPHKIQLIT